MRCSSIPILTKALVDSKHIDEFVRKIVLGPLAAVQGDGRSNGDGRHREGAQDDPLRTVVLTHSKEHEVVARNALQPLSDVPCVELLLIVSGLVEVLLEGRGLVKENATLDCLAVHADPSLGLRRLLLDLLHDLREFGGANTMLDLDVLDSGSVVVLLAELRVVRMGALVGGGTDAQIEAVGRYFESVGLAFQIMDDVLNLRGLYFGKQDEGKGTVAEAEKAKGSKKKTPITNSFVEPVSQRMKNDNY